MAKNALAQVDAFWHQTIYNNGGIDKGVIWCGTDEPWYATGPGYGNNWQQYICKTFDPERDNINIFVESPVIEIPANATSVWFNFDLHSNIPLDNLVFYYFKIAGPPPEDGAGDSLSRLTSVTRLTWAVSFAPARVRSIGMPAGRRCVYRRADTRGLRQCPVRYKHTGKRRVFSQAGNTKDGGVAQVCCDTLSAGNGNIRMCDF